MAARTLGAEEELQLVDPRSGFLAPSAPRLLGRLSDDVFGFELQRSTVETRTAVHTSLTTLGEEVMSRRQTLITAAQEAGLAVAAVGIVPAAGNGDFELTNTGRFSRMQDDYRILVKEHLICGLQIHVGVADRDLAVRLSQRLRSVTPVLLALSASSPFWRGEDTGYASMRTMIWQRWPTTGDFGPVETADDYDRLLARLIATGVITDTKMSYWDVRPGHDYPTVELRVCDACPLLDDALLIAGLFRAAVEREAQRDARGVPLPGAPGPLHRAAMWRAARSGLSGELVCETDPWRRPAREVVRSLVNDLRPQLENCGDWSTVFELCEATLARGSSADRQRLAVTERGDLRDATQLVVDETAGRSQPVPSRLPSVAAYPTTDSDEAVLFGGFLARSYGPLLRSLDSMGAEEAHRREAGMREKAESLGMTFGVTGGKRAFPIDALPRVVASYEWKSLVEGLTQRARAIEHFLRDIYGPARIVHEGVMTEAFVRARPGYQPEAANLPAHTIRGAVCGFDLVRDPLGGWRVIEDNVRTPSGLGYAIGLRRLVGEMFPEFSEGVPLCQPDDVMDLLADTLRASSEKDDPLVVLVSEGSDSSAWFEHRMLAEEAGMLLVTPSELSMTGGKVTTRGRPVDVLYHRLNVELADLTGPTGEPLGSGILEAAAAGGVSVINAPGNGVADDKAMYCYVPDMINFYLGERPKISSVPTYRCSDPEECEIVLARIHELVTKPVDGYGGHGILIGPDAGPDELRERTREIREDGEAWVAQETLDLSTVPTLGAGGLEPRNVDLRAFVLLTGTGSEEARCPTIALTRVAPPGSRVVNSSQGGGAKDTWILDSVEGL